MREEKKTRFQSNRYDSETKSIRFAWFNLRKKRNALSAKFPLNFHNTNIYSWNTYIHTQLFS